MMDVRKAVYTLDFYDPYPGVSYEEILDKTFKNGFKPQNTPFMQMITRKRKG